MRLDNPPKRDYNLPDISGRGEKHHVSYSELDTFRQCPLKWALRYLWRVQPPIKDIRLDRGTAWHSMLESHYRCLAAGGGPEECRKAAQDALNHYALTQFNLPTEEFATLMWMHDGYVKVYRNDPAYEFVGFEEEFEFPMPVDGAPNLIIVGRIDLKTTRKDDGTKQVWDHKSASKRDLSKDGFLNEMLLEDQFILYDAAYQRLGDPVDAVVYSASRTDRLKRDMLDTERFVRVSMTYSEHALEAAWNDATAAATALVASWNDPDRLYSVPNPKQCGWKCDYTRVHIESRNSGRPILEVAADYGMTFKGSKEEVIADEAPEGSGW